MWFVYIVRCADNSLYTGITTDLVRRIKEHNSLKTGAKYTKMKRPVILVYREPAKTRSKALKREAAIKRLSRPQKERLCTEKIPEKHPVK